MSATGQDWAIQLIETFSTLPDAEWALACLREQDGYRGGRVLLASPCNPLPRVQAFFQDEPEAQGWLPDGMRRVILLEGRKAELGVTS